MVEKVVIKNRGREDTSIPVDTFGKLEMSRRTQLIIQKRVDFYDAAGNKVPTLEAVKDIGRISMI